MLIASANRKKSLWVAIYTRKSSAENLDLDFTSLDAQRAHCLSFIKSREAEGWTAYLEEYNDAGISGSTLNRPALQRLLADALPLHRPGALESELCARKMEELGY